MVRRPNRSRRRVENEGKDQRRRPDTERSERRRPARSKKTSKGHRSFNYKKRTESDVRERARQSSGNFDSFIKEEFKLFKPREGKNIIRILPDEGETHWAQHVWVNYGIGADNQSYLSLRMMLEEPDPIDEEMRQAEADGDQKYASALKAKKRSLVWLIDRMNEDEGPLLWAMPWTVERDAQNLSMDEDEKIVLDIDHPDEGQDLRFYREGTGLKTEYNAAKMKFLKPSTISEDEDEYWDWIEYIRENPLGDTIQYYDYDHIAAVLNAGVRMDEDEDEEEPRGRRRSKSRDEDEDEDEDKPRRRALGKRKSRYDEEDEEDDEGDEDEDEDEEEPRGRRGRRSKYKSREEEYDEEDDEGDEDEYDDEGDDDEYDDEEDEVKKPRLRDRIKSRRKPKR